MRLNYRRVLNNQHNQLQSSCILAWVWLLALTKYLHKSVRWPASEHPLPCELFLQACLRRYLLVTKFYNHRWQFIFIQVLCMVQANKIFSQEQKCKASSIIKGASHHASIVQFLLLLPHGIFSAIVITILRAPILKASFQSVVIIAAMINAIAAIPHSSTWIQRLHTNQ